MLKKIILFTTLLPHLFSFTQAPDPISEGYHKAFYKAVHKNTATGQSYLDSIQALTPQNQWANYYLAYDKAYYYFVIHRLDSCKYYFQKALDYRLEKHNSQQIVDAHIWLSNIASFSGDDQAAKKGYKECLDLSLKTNYSNGIIEGLYGLASLEPNEAAKFQYYTLIIDYCTNHHYSSAVLANTYYDIGTLQFYSLGNTALAEKYFKKSYSTSVANNYLPGENAAYFMLSEIAISNADYATAEKILNQLLNNSIKSETQKEEAHYRLSRANLYLQQGKKKQALTNCQIATTIFRQINDSIALSYALLSQAEIELALDNIIAAEQTIKAAKELANKEKKYALMEAKVLINYYSNAENYKAAWEQQLILDELKAQELEEKRSTDFLNLERRYTSEIQAQEIELLRAQKTISAVQDKNRIRLFGLILFLILILIGFILFLYFQRLKKHRELEAINRMKSEFFTNVSHEFRTPLSLISIPIQNELNREDVPQKNRKIYTTILRNCDRLIQLIDQVLDLSKVDSDFEKLNLTPVGAYEFFEQIIERFQIAVLAKNIRFIASNKLPKGDYLLDYEKVEKITSNLLSNALKYTNAGEEIQVHINYSIEKEEIQLSVKNTGAHLNRTELNKIFNRFYQVKPDQKGNGIGLALAQNLAQIHNGEITAESASNWVKFDARISSQRVAPIAFAIQATEEPNKRKLLIIEDHPELNEVIQAIFAADFEIYTAPNGKIGLEIAQKEIPDIILTDLMMPEMDGITLIKHVRNHELLNHIPIIVLTAKDLTAEEKGALESTTNDYLIKPFKPQELQNKVEQIIARRKALAHYLKQELLLSPKKLSAEHPKDRFLEKLKNVTENQLNNPDFTVEEFAKEMHLSRMQLYRKIKAVTQLTPREFIRNKRLVQGKELLENSDLSISEIAHLIGFSVPSQFTRAYKQVYNTTPLNYRESLKK